MSRPTRLTPLVQSRVLEALTKGATLEHAAAYAGIGYNTICLWRSLGALPDADPEFVEFREKTEIARSGVAVDLSEVILNAATKKGNWLAAITMLERQYPEQYARRSEIKVDYGKLQDEELLTLAEQAGLIASPTGQEITPGRTAQKRLSGPATSRGLEVTEEEASSGDD